MRSFVAAECEREANGKMTLERRYFISSQDGKDAHATAQAVRHHWHVENGLHWVLDVGFNEGRSRNRVRNAAENFSRLRRTALNLVNRNKTIKAGVKAKRRRAGWDEHDMVENLTG
jgi:predicted transposase YbfD/YdcC